MFKAISLYVCRPTNSEGLLQKSKQSWQRQKVQSKVRNAKMVEIGKAKKPKGGPLAAGGAGKGVGKAPPVEYDSQDRCVGGLRNMLDIASI